jgi:hypothetical protein
MGTARIWSHGHGPSTECEPTGRQGDESTCSVGTEVGEHERGKRGCGKDEGAWPCSFVSSHKKCSYVKCSYVFICEQSQEVFICVHMCSYVSSHKKCSYASICEQS